MARLHAIQRGIDAIRPTNDVDIVLHVETTRGGATADLAANDVVDVFVADHAAPRVREHLRGRDGALPAAMGRPTSDRPDGDRPAVDDG